MLRCIIITRSVIRSAASTDTARRKATSTPNRRSSYRLSYRPRMTFLSIIMLWKALIMLGEAIQQASAHIRALWAISRWSDRRVRRRNTLHSLTRMILFPSTLSGSKVHRTTPHYGDQGAPGREGEAPDVFETTRRAIPTAITPATPKLSARTSTQSTAHQCPWDPTARSSAARTSRATAPSAASASTAANT